MRLAIGKPANKGIVIAVGIVLVIAALSVWQYRQIRSTGVVVKHLDSVLYGTGEVAMAGDSAGLLHRKIEGLRSLVVNDPDVRSRVDSLAAFYGGAGPAMLPILTGIAADERRRLDQLRADNQLRASELQWTLWALMAGVVVLAAWIFRKIRLELGEAREARERSEVARERSEDKYKMLFFKSPLAKWIYDEETLRFLEVNDAAVRMYGYSQEEFRKLTLVDIRPREDLDRLMVDIREVRRNPLSVQAGQWRHVRKDGEVIDVELTAHPVELDGRHARMVAVVDITESRRYERQLQRLNGDLQRLNADLERRAVELTATNAELERFAYIASHDLQEPLRMVTSFLQLLEKKYGGQLDDRADQYIHYAVDGAERMKALIMDLLEYSRLGTGKEGFDWVDCGEVMTEVGEVFREQIAAAGANLEIGPLPRVWGDEVQLTQLFQNLLSNALKYVSDEPPVIRITAEERPAYWEFSVADNGIGIEPQFFDKVFIIFQRLHNKNEYSGTGIGLAICKKIVERHGGRIWVESGAEGSGSAFKFTINKKF